MNIQRLSISDVDVAIEASRIFYNTTPEKEKILSFLGDPRNYLLIYKVNDNIAGYAYGYELPRFDGKNSMMYLHAIEVLPEYRRQGFGREMMNEIIDICKKNNFLKMFLITEKSNVPAVALYEKTGGIVKHDDYTVFDYGF